MKSAVILSLAGLLLLPGLAMSQPHVPCDNRNAQKKPLFGETHAHTEYSFDALSIGTTNKPEDSYRYAKGEPIQIPGAVANSTRCAQLVRPLDWAALTDHSEFLGELTMCFTPGAPGYDSPSCANYRENPEEEASVWGSGLTDHTPPKPPDFCGPNGATCYQQSATLWEKIQTAAENAYDRTPACQFTSFVGYEWTSMPGFDNRHRNVIFRNEHVPARPVSVFESTNDERRLWSQLKAECLDAGTGCDVLTIPHNGNLSNGKLYTFPPDLNRTPAAAAAYASERSWWEPLSEIHQGKGNSECRTGVETTDPECGFEQLADHNLNFLTGAGPGEEPFAPNSFLRNVLKDGLADEKRLGANPFKLGFAGGTDTHTALPGGTDEGNFQGIHGTLTASPEGLLSQVQFNAGALTVAWAEENTRESIFDALRRREAYATSGTRPIVRFFAGWDLPANLCDRSDFVPVGYAQGVPMGSDLNARPAGSTQGPRFAVLATKDSMQTSSGACETAPAPNCWVKCPGAGLNRIEIIKGWLDAQGTTHEKVVTVVESPNNKSGKWVDPATCKPLGGSPMLCGVWTDPEFDPAAPAFYYARVLENPSCRWSTYTCKGVGLDPFNKPACLEGLQKFSDQPPGPGGGRSPRQIYSTCCNMVPGPEVSPTDIPIVEKQRAWTSPVWYRPVAAAPKTQTSAKTP